MIGTTIWNILFWISVGIAIGGLISWLLGARSETDTDTRLGLADFEGRNVTIREERSQLADQLQVIEGVGPQVATVFHENGIHRFSQIAAMAPAAITKVLATGGSAFDIARPFTWPFQARLLENGWYTEFFHVKDQLRAGRLRLHGIKGIGDATADRLHEMEVGSVEVLAESDPAVVAAKLKDAGENVPESRVAGWVDEARKLHAGDMGFLAAYFGVPAGVLGMRDAATYADHREVSGPLVEANSLLGLTSATATATARPSLLPFWLGLGGAILFGLLNALGLGKADVDTDVDTVAAPAPATVMATELGSDTTFETDSAVLTDAGKAEIDSKIIEPARGHNVTSVRVVGHADVRADDAYNLELSRERARAVAAYLNERATAEGITWNTRGVQVFGAGEEFPNPAANTAVDCAALLESDPTSAETSACFAPDRRVEVTIIAAGDATTS